MKKAYERQVLLITAAALIFLLISHVCHSTHAEQLSGGVQFPPSAAQYDLAGHLEILKDPKHAWSIDEVRQAPLSGKFSSPGPGVPHLGLTDAAVWVRFRTDQQLPENWVLHVGWPYLASVSFRELKERPGEAVIGTSPGERRFTAWAFPGRNAAKWTVYARFVSQGMLSLPVKLYTESAYLSYQRLRSLGYGVYYGIILAMAFYKQSGSVELSNRRGEGNADLSVDQQVGDPIQFGRLTV